MKKKIIIMALLILLMCGCGKTIPKLENGEEAVVEFSDGSMISVDDLYAELKEEYATDILIEMIDTKILEDKYSDKLEDADDYAESYLKTVKSYYVDDNGDYDESSLLSALNQYGYSSIESYQDALKLSYLRNEAVKDYAKTKVTDKQINKYYKEEIVANRTISHIEIIPDVTDDMTDDEKTTAEDDALALAKEIITKLKKGEKFEDLAKEYSDDTKTNEDGGSLGSINKGDYGSDEFDEEAWSLAVGKYSTTPVKTDSGYEIIYVVSEDEKASLEDVKDDIIDTLSTDLISDDSTIQIAALEDVRSEYGVNITDTELNTKYNKYINNLYAQAEEE